MVNTNPRRTYWPSQLSADWCWSVLYVSLTRPLYSDIWSNISVGILEYFKDESDIWISRLWVMHIILPNVGGHHPPNQLKLLVGKKDWPFWRKGKVPSDCFRTQKCRQVPYNRSQPLTLSLYRNISVWRHMHDTFIYTLESLYAIYIYIPYIFVNIHTHRHMSTRPITSYWFCFSGEPWLIPDPRSGLRGILHTLLPSTSVLYVCLCTRY